MNYYLLVPRLLPGNTLHSRLPPRVPVNGRQEPARQRVTRQEPGNEDAIMSELAHSLLECVAPCVCLIGAGTVGRAILDVHLHCGVEVVLIDASQGAIDDACTFVRA